MGGFTAQAFALFFVLAPGGLFFLSFHSSPSTTKLDLQRGPVLDTAFFVIAASVMHLFAGLALLYGADALASCSVVRSLAALAGASPTTLSADRRCGTHTGVLLAASYFVLVNAAAWVAGRSAAGFVASHPRLFGALYGPYYDPPRFGGADQAPIIIANVMTDVEHEGRVLMYEGRLDELSLSPSKTANYVCLTNAQRFYMHLGRAEATTSQRRNFKSVDRKGVPASRLMIPGDKIKNVLTRTYHLTQVPMDTEPPDVSADRRSVISSFRWLGTLFETYRKRARPK